MGDQLFHRDHWERKVFFLPSTVGASIEVINYLDVIRLN
jgi:hypothetical protein